VTRREERLMFETYITLAAITLLMSGAAHGQPTPIPEMAIRPAQSRAVVVTKAAIADALEVRSAQGSGMALANLAAVRAGDDRISLDLIRRDDPRAEGPVLHSAVTEVYYVLQGGGVLETDGQLPDPAPATTPSGAPLNPASIGPTLRGARIDGGSTRHVAAGDAILIPPNVPHRFRSIDGSITYIVVRTNPDYEKSR
jgi:mannose-6-phosphate isomerase-like protein (cupin superfamily)